MKPLCRNCGAKQSCRPRGLCHTCYYAPGVREKFPRHRNDPNAEPTEAELEAMIAEEMRNLPSWWDGQTELAESELGYRAKQPKWLGVKVEKGDRP